MNLNGQVGNPGVIADGITTVNIRTSRDACTVTQDGHGRYVESIARSNSYVLSTPLAGVALGATHASQTAATATPIVGFMNPFGSGVYCAILESVYGVQATGAAAVNEGIPVYQIAQVSATTAPITQTGSTPLPTSAKSLTAGGSKCMPLVNVPLTGNTVAWTMLKPFVGAGGGGPRVTAPTASINVNTLMKDDLGGIILIPPGFAFGLFVLASGTAITSAANLLWEEIAQTLIT